MHADERKRSVTESVELLQRILKENERVTYLPGSSQPDDLFPILVDVNFLSVHTLLVPEEDQHERAECDGDGIPFGVCRCGRRRNPPRASQSS